MLNRLKNLSFKLSTTLDAISISGFPKFLIVSILSLVFISASLFLVSWVYDWLNKGLSDRPGLLQFINTLTSTSFMAALVILGKGLVDSNNNGIPDSFDSFLSKNTPSIKMEIDKERDFKGGE